MDKFFSPFYFSNITIFWAIFFQQSFPWQEGYILCETFAKQVKQCTYSENVTRRMRYKAIALALLCCNIYLIPRQIYVKTFSFSQTHCIIIRFFEWWPEFLMFIAMPRKVQYTENKKIKIQFDKKIVEITLYPEPGDCIAWKQENKTIPSILLSSLKGFRLLKLIQ